MSDTRIPIIMALSSFVLYLLVSWGYMALADGGSREFWGAFGVLLAFRIFFSIVETFGSIILWRLYGKKLMVHKFVGMLRDSDFPQREFARDDFLSYLSRIESGDEYSASVKSAAKEIYFVLGTFEKMGILLGMRMHAAADAALDAYSPKSKAPVFGATHA